MLRNLVDSWRGPKRHDPWRELVRNSASGLRSANESISRIVDRAGRLPEQISAGGEPGALFELRLRTKSRIGHVVEPAEIRKLASVHSFRYEAYNREFSMSAMVGPDSTEEPDALAYGYFQDVTSEPYGGGTLFAPGFVPLGTLIEYGKRLRRLFERDDAIGMPPSTCGPSAAGSGTLACSARPAKARRRPRLATLARF